MIGQSTPCRKGAAWTEEQEAYVRARLRAGEDLDGIAHALGRTPATVRDRARRLGIALTSKRRRVWDERRDKALEELCAQGLRRDAVAHRLGVSVAALVSRAKLLGIRLPPAESAAG